MRCTCSFPRHPSCSPPRPPGARWRGHLGSPGHASTRQRQDFLQDGSLGPFHGPLGSYMVLGSGPVNPNAEINGVSPNFQENMWKKIEFSQLDFLQ